MARHLVIEIDRHGINAVDVAVSRGRARPAAAVTAVRPADVDAADPEAMGPWIGRVLADAGIKTRTATLALSRERATFRRLDLPWAEDEELPGMVELACGRELPIGAGEAVVDFVPLDGPGAAATGAAAETAGDAPSRSGRRVLAAAIPRPALDQLLAIASAAGLKVASAMPRAIGAARLVSDEDEPSSASPPASAADATDPADASAASSAVDPAAGHDHGADEDAEPTATLLIDVGVHACEFLVVHRGRIQFVRAASIAPLAAGTDVRRTDVVTETRRTWMSLRVSEDLPIARIVMLGDRAVASEAVIALASGLGIPGRIARLPDSIATRRPDPDDMGDASSADATIESAGLWPLVGLALPAGPAGGLDFLNPRRAPDRRRIAGRRVALVALLLIIVGGGLWTMGRQELARLRAEEASVRGRAAELSEPYNRLQREVARRSHLRRWESVDPGWIEQFARLESALPPPGEAVLENLTATLDFRGVTYDRREREWAVPLQVRIALDGAASDLDAAGQVRGSFVRDEAFRVTSTGSDGQLGRRLPVGFGYRLATAALVPPSIAAEFDAALAALDAARDSESDRPTAPVTPRPTDDAAVPAVPAALAGGADATGTGDDAASPSSATDAGAAESAPASVTIPTDAAVPAGRSSG